MPPGKSLDATSICSGPHGPCGAGAVLATTSLFPLQYSARNCFRCVLYCTDISPTGPGMTGCAAPGFCGTQLPPSQYSYRLNSGTAFCGTRETNAEPLRPDGVPYEYRYPSLPLRNAPTWNFSPPGT